MSRIKGWDTKPELRVRRFLHASGLRFRLHRKDLPGRPDLVFPSRRVALFVHGCFWHGHEGCSRFRMPASRRDYWRPKIERNLKRDAQAAIELAELGWKRVVIWECEIDGDALRTLAERISATPIR